MYCSAFQRTCDCEDMVVTFNMIWLMQQKSPPWDTPLNVEEQLRLRQTSAQQLCFSKTVSLFLITNHPIPFHFILFPYLLQPYFSRRLAEARRHETSKLLVPAAAQAATDTPAAPTAFALLAALFAKRSSSGAGRYWAPKAKATSAAKCWQLQPWKIWSGETVLS